MKKLQRNKQKVLLSTWKISRRSKLDADKLKRLLKIQKNKDAKFPHLKILVLNLQKNRQIRKCYLDTSVHISASKCDKSEHYSMRARTSFYGKKYRQGNYISHTLLYVSFPYNSFFLFCFSFPFPKGQLISKCPFGVFKSSKKPTKFFPGFLP